MLLLIKKLAGNAGIATKLARDENGATAIEYGLIAALISVIAITSIQPAGTGLSSEFAAVASQL